MIYKATLPPEDAWPAKLKEMVSNVVARESFWTDDGARRMPEDLVNQIVFMWFDPGRPASWARETLRRDVSEIEARCCTPNLL
jgi:hypothetical protein